MSDNYTKEITDLGFDKYTSEGDEWWQLAVDKENIPRFFIRVKISEKVLNSCISEIRELLMGSSFLENYCNLRNFASTDLLLVSLDFWSKRKPPIAETIFSKGPTNEIWISTYASSSGFSAPVFDSYDE